MERKHLTSLEQVEDLVKSNIFFEIMGSKVLVELVAWFAKAWGSPQRCIYVICESNRSAEIWRNSLLRTNMKWMGHDGASQAPSVPIFFPGFAFSDFRQSQISEDIWDARSVACCFLATNRAKIVTTTIEAMSQRTLGKAEWSKRTVRIEKGKEYSQDLLEGLLNELGFAQVSEIERIGDVSFNGGLVDLFTPENGPVRLVYFGDHVAEIFQIERGSLRNSDTLDSIVLSPPREVVFPNGCWSEQLQRLHDTLLNLDLTTAQRNLIFDNVSHRRRNQGCEYWNQLLNEHIGAAWDWVKDDDYLIFPDGLVRCRVAFEDRVSKVARGEYLGGDFPTKAFKLIYHHEAKIPHGNAGCSFEPNDSLTHYLWEEDQAITELEKFDGVEYFEHVVSVLKTLLSNGSLIVVLSQDQDTIERVLEFFSKLNLPCVLSNHPLEEDRRGSIIIATGCLEGQLWIAEKNTFVIPDYRLFGKHRNVIRRGSVANFQHLAAGFIGLQAGEYMIHMKHGIGVYRGLAKLLVGGRDTEFIVLEYDKGDRLYVPVDSVGSLSRHYGSEGEISIDRLGGDRWQRVRERAIQEAKEIAASLLATFSQRLLFSAPICAADALMTSQFESLFEHTETPDQALAIETVYDDLKKGVPMDRLICGDAGFGKTEVAMRAIFQVVCAGYQVLFIVPTTVLAFQHYKTMQQRFHSTAVAIGYLSGSSRTAQAKNYLERFSTGRVDILIGTHRLLSQDVVPLKLGLVVIDEEQKFGVSHKENLRKRFQGVHVLTLTATPIPRTLQISMLGLRDMSILATPPAEKKVVETYVAAFSESIIKFAINREISRGGQILYVHNRITDMEGVILKLKSMIPKLSVLGIHGRMKKNDVEKALVSFVDGKYQVLVATSIVEAGLDMPNVNTLVVSDAHRYGLAQLYQLRGRVGRGRQQAYAYFLAPSGMLESMEVCARLNVLERFQEFGSGFQIANRDLDARGSGNVLGLEQSGTSHELGWELFSGMLENEVRVFKGQGRVSEVDVEIRFPVDVTIPDSYVRDEFQRIVFYRKIFSCRVDSEVDEALQILSERYGALVPPQVQAMGKLAKLKIRLRRMQVIEVSIRDKHFLEVRFENLSKSRVDLLLQVIEARKETFVLMPGNRLNAVIPGPFDIRDSIGTLEHFTKVLEPIFKLGDIP